MLRIKSTPQSSWVSVVSSSCQTFSTIVKLIITPFMCWKRIHFLVTKTDSDSKFKAKLSRTCPYFLIWSCYSLIIYTCLDKFFTLYITTAELLSYCRTSSIQSSRLGLWDFLPCAQTCLLPWRVFNVQHLTATLFIHKLIPILLLHCQQTFALPADVAHLKNVPGRTVSAHEPLSHEKAFNVKDLHTLRQEEIGSVDSNFNTDRGSNQRRFVAEKHVRLFIITH